MDRPEHPGSRPLNVASFCAGFGFGDDAVALALPDARTVVACEIEEYAIRVLVEEMEAGRRPACPVWTDLLTFAGRPWRGTVDLLIAGFPCQGSSVAGKRLGVNDERWIWPDLARVLGEMDAPYALFENVPGLLSVNDGEAFREVLSDLATLGYDTRYGLFRASDVGAPHKRERWFLFARSRRVVDAEGRGHPSIESLIDWQRPVVRSRPGADGGAAPGDRAEGIRLGGTADAAGPADLRDGALADGAARGGALGLDPGLARGEGWPEHAGLEGRRDAALAGGHDGRGPLADPLRDGERGRVGQAGPGRRDGQVGDAVGRGDVADGDDDEPQERQGDDRLGGERPQIRRWQLEPAGPGAGGGAARGDRARGDAGDQAAAGDAGDGLGPDRRGPVGDAERAERRADLSPGLVLSDGADPRRPEADGAPERAGRDVDGGGCVADAGGQGLEIRGGQPGDVRAECPPAERDGRQLVRVADGADGRGDVADGLGGGGERRGIARDLAGATGETQGVQLQREWRRRAADDPGAGAMPLFPPGPRSLRWLAVAYHRPDLFPALTPDGRIPPSSPFYPFFLAGERARALESKIRGLADGRDHSGGPRSYLPDCDCPRTDLLRGAGNGVVPHCEALALLVLISRMGWAAPDSESNLDDKEVQLDLALTD